MIKVTRTPKPQSLHINASQWTKELLHQINTRHMYQDVPDSYKNKYRQDDVKTALETMYAEKCCYCETGIGESDYEHIEHRKPKSLPQFYNLTFDWDNLHWSCSKCNNKKRIKWDQQNPILDPAIDDPKDHLEPDIISGEIVSKTARGQTTIDHTGLNREKLKKARKRLLSKAWRMINQANKTESDEDNIFYRNELLRMCTSNLPEDRASYSMFIKKLVESELV